MKFPISRLLVVMMAFSFEAQAAEDTNQSALKEVIHTAATGDVGGVLESKALGYASSQLESAGKSWLERVFPTSELYLGLSDPGKPTFGVLVLAPLSNPDDTKNTFFTQDSVYRFDDRTTVNLGLGYRRLEMDDKLLLGVNAFYDHEFPYDHGRTSLGFEARTTVGEININRYWGVTGWKDGRDGLQERALGGYDAELGVPLPYLPWAKVYGRYFRWEGVDGANDVKGADLSLRANVPVFQGLAIEAGHRYYDNLQDENFLRVTMNVTDLFRPTSSKPIVAENAYSLDSMVAHRYDKVRRENLIYKQKRRGKFTVTARGFS